MAGRRTCGRAPPARRAKKPPPPTCRPSQPTTPLPAPKHQTQIQQNEQETQYGLNRLLNKFLDSAVAVTRDSYERQSLGVSAGLIQYSGAACLAPGCRLLCRGPPGPACRGATRPGVHSAQGRGLRPRCLALLRAPWRALQTGMRPLPPPHPTGPQNPLWAFMWEVGQQGGDLDDGLLRNTEDYEQAGGKGRGRRGQGS